MTGINASQSSVIFLYDKKQVSFISYFVLVSVFPYFKKYEGSIIYVICTQSKLQFIHYIFYLKSFKIPKKFKNYFTYLDQKLICNSG